MLPRYPAFAKGQVNQIGGTFMDAIALDPRLRIQPAYLVAIR